MSDRTAYDLGQFPADDNLYCPDCGGAKTRAGQEWHTWNCTYAVAERRVHLVGRFGTRAPADRLSMRVAAAEGRIELAGGSACPTRTTEGE